jgi:hypothetical protein
MGTAFSYPISLPTVVINNYKSEKERALLGEEATGDRTGNRIPI